MTRTPIRLALAAAALALAGCHHEPDAPPADTENSAFEAPANAPEPTPEPTRTISDEPPAMPPPAAASANLSTPVEPELRETPPSPDAQMLDDADATGMTSRRTRSESDGNQAPAP